MKFVVPLASFLAQTGTRLCVRDRACAEPLNELLRRRYVQHGTHLNRDPSSKLLLASRAVRTERGASLTCAQADRDDDDEQEASSGDGQSDYHRVIVFAFARRGGRAKFPRPAGRAGADEPARGLILAGAAVFTRTTRARVVAQRSAVVRRTRALESPVAVHATAAVVTRRRRTRTAFAQTADVAVRACAREVVPLVHAIAGDAHGSGAHRVALTTVGDVFETAHAESRFGPSEARFGVVRGEICHEGQQLVSDPDFSQTTDEVHSGCLVRRRTKMDAGCGHEVREGSV